MLSENQKYLGNRVTSKGLTKQTFEERRGKAYGATNEIISILDEVPLGRFKLEIGLCLRNALFLNSILFSSEAR